MSYAEIIEHQRLVSTMQNVAALHELAALQQLAALADWPQPEPDVSVSRAPSTRTVAVAPYNDAAFASSLIDAINATRARTGLAPIRVDARLVQSSSSYAQLLASIGALTHTAGGTTMDSRAAAVGFPTNVAMGEVLAYTTAAPSTSAILQLWLDSPDHRAQILSPSFSVAGAGCALSGGELRCVVDLAG